MNPAPLVDRIEAFFGAIGLKSTRIRLAGPTFLPGISIQNGRILFDPEALLYPGDLLHEAGHLAVTPGAAGLALRGMTRVGGSPAADTAEPVYPSMRRWLAD